MSLRINLTSWTKSGLLFAFPLPKPVIFHVLSLQRLMKVSSRFRAATQTTAMVVALFFMTAALSDSHAQDTSHANPLADIRKAIATGEAKTLLQHASERVELNLFGASTVYSPGQAVYVIRDFFHKYPPRQFRFQVFSQSDHNWFVEGIYRHERERTPLRIYLRLQNTGERWWLREIRIGQHEEE